MTEVASAEARGSALHGALAVVRHHIVLIAMAASCVFGWLMTGERPWLLSLVVGLDWFLINLMNRITDLEEDRRNGIEGTGLVARHGRAMTVAAVLLMVGSFVGTHLVWPELTPWRVAVQVIGLGYNYDIVPTPSGMRRFKELYFLKNWMSAMLFVLTCFVYPIVAAGPDALAMGWPAIAALVLFFVPFELTYEIVYDLRDLEGDRAEGVPTYPVVHGEETARRIIDALLALSAAVLLAAVLTGTLGLREGLMLAAPAIQLAVYRRFYRRGITRRDCILITHLGTALLLVYVAGTAAWSAAGLPDNVHLGLLG